MLMASKNMTTIVMLTIMLGAIGVTGLNLKSFNIPWKSYPQPVEFTMIEDSEYNFHVYCPIDSQTGKKYYSDLIEDTGLLTNTTLYVIYMNNNVSQGPAYNNTVGMIVDQTDFKLYYCGWARPWNGTCADASHVCSIPGPAFYLPVYEEINIAWIYNITGYDMELAQETDGCYVKGPKLMTCEVEAKIIDEQHPETESCTYYRPTNLTRSVRNVKVNLQQIPVSPHIHGIDIRPIFDGNPHSWFNNKGDKGTGYISLTDKEYFSHFDRPHATSLRFTNKYKNMKVSKVPNRQIPGILFYHDHAMMTTQFNVAHGMAGYYILHNKTAEKHLPKDEQQKLLFFSGFNAVDLRIQRKNLADSLKNSSLSPSHLAKKSQSNSKSTTNDYGNDYTDTFKRNMTYRFRVLNGHFETYNFNVSFVVLQQTYQLANNRKALRQINPFENDEPLSKYMKRINFTMIGADSALFNEPIHHLHFFDLATAERKDVLVKFGPQNGVPLHFKHVYMVCNEKNLTDYIIKYDFVLNNIKTHNKYLNPSQYQALNIPFIDLSTIPKSQIALNRMKPMLNRPKRIFYQITGYHMFDDGKLEMPKIGTIQDWYFMGQETPHPLHIHLINFQFIHRFGLKYLVENCSVYELDYFRFSKFPKFVNMTNKELCDYLNIMTEDEIPEMMEYFKTYRPEDEIKETNIGKVAGLNVFDLIETEQDRQNYAIFNNCSLNNKYKYICDDISTGIKPYERRWKEIALLKEFTLTVLRIRWTSTNHNVSDPNAQYFNSGTEDEMTEFPGFIYHCHRLRHEDNQMMRSFMLEPSDRYLNNLAKNQTTFKRHSKHLHNAQPKKAPYKDIWLERETKINKDLKCPK